MARKRTKEEARKRLASLPKPPAFLGKLPGAPGLATRALRASQGLAGLLIEVDPLNRLAETPPIPPKVTKEALKVDRNEVVMRMVNDPGIKIDDNMRDAINDDAIMMAPSGELMQRIGSRQVIDVPLMAKRRRKSKNDKIMSTCLREANRRLRTKSGRLRKGKTQSDVMKLAQRLCKKAKR